MWSFRHFKQTNEHWVCYLFFVVTFSPKFHLIEQLEIVHTINNLTSNMSLKWRTSAVYRPPISSIVVERSKPNNIIFLYNMIYISISKVIYFSKGIKVFVVAFANLYSLIFSTWAYNF